MEICNRCLGRLIIGATGLEAQLIAASEFDLASRDVTIVEDAKCKLCEGMFLHLDRFVSQVEVALAKYEYNSFQLGTQFPTELEQREKSLKAEWGIEHTESLRTELNRILGPILSEKLGKELIKDGRPDVVIQVDLLLSCVRVTSNAIYIAGRYTKLRRDLPQTHWPCKKCDGTGCFQCDKTGKQYEDSVEEAIGDVAKPYFSGVSYSFHGAGREDIDALMLGRGRPFVLEIQEPINRVADLEAIMAEINANTDPRGVGVCELRMTEREEVARIKEADYQKEYIAHCVLDAPITAEKLAEVCEHFTDVVLDQRTPERVSHRRADLIRNRTVFKTILEKPLDESGTRFSVRILAESGTYIKEFINGDEGRTQPNFVDTLGVTGKVEFLDVLEILD